ncbi:Ribonuclease H-like domain [Phytophthora cactorum]|nr:Ribonuclease H-like domain [Phytophthora cactorum]
MAPNKLMSFGLRDCSSRSFTSQFSSSESRRLIMSPGDLFFGKPVMLQTYADKTLMNPEGTEAALVKNAGEKRLRNDDGTVSIKSMNNKHYLTVSDDDDGTPICRFDACEIKKLQKFHLKIADERAFILCYVQLPRYLKLLLHRLWRRSVLLQAVRQGSQADAWNGLHQPHQPLRGEAPGYTKTYDESQRTHGRSLEAHGFVDQRTMEIFKWMEWIVARNHALSEVDDPLTRSLAAVKPISSKTSMRYMRHVAAKVGARIAVDMNGQFGLMFDGWTSGTTHFVAIYGIFTKDGILSQVLLSISPAEYGQSAEAYFEMIDAVFELYNKDSAMIMFIVADNCATNQAIATRLGFLSPKPISAGGLSIAFNFIFYFRTSATGGASQPSLCDDLGFTDVTPVQEATALPEDTPNNAIKTEYELEKRHDAIMKLAMAAVHRRHPLRLYGSTGDKEL